MLKKTISALVLLGLVGNAWALQVFDDTAGNLPSDQGWLAFATNGSGSQSAVTGIGVQVSSSGGDSTGYSNWAFVPGFGFGSKINAAFPDLDPGNGFSLSFELQVLTEAHDNNDRAGFSVLLLGSDNKGIELGFWSDLVWAQDDVSLFTHAEEAMIDTTVSEMLYELTIQGANYELTADGNSLLTGATRDYTAFGGAPYTLPSLLFLGDDTSSAGADFVLGEVVLNEDLSVPLPASLWLLLGGMAVIVRLGAASLK